MDRIAFIIGETFVFWSPIIIAVSALAAACWFIGLYLGRTGKGIAAFLAVPLAFVTSMFFGRVIHWYCRTDSYASFEAAVTDYTAGDYALLGVFVGCILTAAILRLIQVSKSMPEMLDCMAVAGAVGISVCRLASFFNSSDRGMIMKDMTELPLVYPVTNVVTGEPEYRLATFMLQSLVTGGIFVVLLLFWLGMKKKGRKGDTFLMFSLLYGAAQAVLDSTRYDSLFLRSNGFVSIVQIVGAVSMVLAIVWFSVRMVKAWGWRYWFLAFWLGIGGCLGGAGYMEYYVQRHGDQALFAYTVMTGCLIGTILLGIVLYILAVIGENSKRLAERRKLKKEKKANRKKALQAEPEQDWEEEENTMPVMEISQVTDMTVILGEEPETADPEEIEDSAADERKWARMSEGMEETKVVTIPAAAPALPADAAPMEEEPQDLENAIAPDTALEDMTTDELLAHLKSVLDGDL